MGLLQAAYRTYETFSHLAGVKEDGKEALTPVSHMVQNSNIEISIDADGKFQSAYAVAKEDAKTIIPATIASASRTSAPEAHPLCDQLGYLSPYNERKFELYLSELRRWEESDFSHPKVRAVLAYVQGGTIVNDLLAAGLIKLDEEAGASKHDKDFIRWRVSPASDEDKSACWEDATLFQAYADYYADQCAVAERDICLITGQEDMVSQTHAKGVISLNGNAKLISANDSSGFTYRGRFSEARQAYNVGYTASQKAHHALHWVASNYGVILGGRTFLCWNPEGKPVPTSALFGFSGTEKPDFVDYKKQLCTMLGGYRNDLKDTDDIVIASLDAATTGRLSVTYYSEIKAPDFLNRIEDWYTGCCLETSFWGAWSPSIRRIAECTCGTQQGEFIKADDRVLREYVQRLINCIVANQLIPQDIVAALTNRAGNLLPYSARNREHLLATTCAIVRKYRNDRAEREEWNVALDINSTDRSYLFGRLLAVAEQVERCTYDHDEGREPNALRMQAVFSQRPMYGWRLIEEKLNPYFARLSPGFRKYFRNLIGEITDKLPGAGDPELGKQLSDTYLLGYYHQRTAMTKKKAKNTEEDKNNESAE